MKYEIRPFRAEDLDYLVDAWLNSWRTNRYAGVVPNHLYYSTHRTLIEDLIARGATIVVADTGKKLKNGKAFILGFACAEEKDGICILHYTTTKDPFLRRGVEAALIEALPGRKPGRITHHLDRFTSAGWLHTPAMARRKVL